eukprot:TRINITY_DN12026_c0_g2_i1.p2 TRINITY_DN12026_c0_g2~~TRINITY_DN12026_c0_g2_i1.p2  ORF type:complete len:629 (+),score=95.76 TRINITY_DN12026_c0_g2_i1:3345-5231(+)
MTRVAWAEITQKTAPATSDSILNAISIIAERPHLINRRLAASELLTTTTIAGKACTATIAAHVPTINVQTDLRQLLNLSDSVELTLRHHLSRSPDNHPHYHEAYIVDHARNSVSFCALTTADQHTPIFRLNWTPRDREQSRDASEDACVFTLEALVAVDAALLGNARLALEFGLLDQQPVELVDLKLTEECRAKLLTGTFKWLVDKYFAKLLVWSHPKDTGSVLSAWRPSPAEAPVHPVAYAHRYRELKAKYGPGLVEAWTEGTDPEKFVYEDIGIATYLILLFERYHDDASARFDYKFIDLGCGNGLLCWLLAQEGYQGIGLDLTRRRIWDRFGADVELRNEAVVPHHGLTYPKCEWILGNHSDELTPWIPIIAGDSSYHHKFWVLPCCPFILNGQRFSSNAKHHDGSGYFNYLDYVKQLAKDVGFDVQTDLLRIPSTRRICMVGAVRSYQHGSEDEVAARRKRLDYIQQGNTFVPREQNTTRKVNCRSVPQDLKDTIVHTVFKHVMELDKDECVTTADGRTYHTGGLAPMKDIPALFEPAQLKRLKSECGGLQTLLKLNGHIFNVRGGQVALRTPDTMRYNPDAKAFKRRLCWLCSNHPDGCPRPAASCSYAHSEDELRTNADNSK